MTFSSGRPRRPRAGGAAAGLVIAIIGALATWLCWRYFVGRPDGQLIDDAALVGSSIGRNVLWQAAEPVLDVVSVSFVVVVLTAVALIAVLRRRWLLAVQVSVLVGGANVTTQLLKHVVWDRPDLAETSGAAANSLPSGHTTVAASVAAALVLVVPRRIRPAVAVVAAVYATATGVATMVGGWHRPSDVVAAITVVMAWAGLTITLTALARPEPVRVANPSGAATTFATGLLVVGGGLAGTIAGSALLRTRDLLAESSQLTDRSDLAAAYAGGALGVIAAAAITFAAILVGYQLASRPHPAVGVAG